MLKNICLFVLAAVIVACVYLLAGVQLDRPQMIVDESGECTSARGPQGPIMCTDIKEEDWGNYDIEKAYKPLSK